jgi:TPP-dependent pyruvate/acetoin dehydrogenase alpha subunit
VTYRTADEVTEWRTTRDPIDKLVAGMRLHAMLQEGQLDSLVEEAKQIVADAIDFARSSAWPVFSPGLVTGLDFTPRGNP